MLTAWWYPPRTAGRRDRQTLSSSTHFLDCLLCGCSYHGAGFTFARLSPVPSLGFTWTHNVSGGHCQGFSLQRTGAVSSKVLDTFSRHSRGICKAQGMVLHARDSKRKRDPGKAAPQQGSKYSNKFYRMFWVLGSTGPGKLGKVFREKEDIWAGPKENTSSDRQRGRGQRP